MSRIRYLILLLSLVSILGACGYSFILKGGGNLGTVNLYSCTNQTPLRSAGIMLDQHMENVLAAYGLYSTEKSRPNLKCIVLSTSKSQVTAYNINTPNTYRLSVTVRAEVFDESEKKIWQGDFTDDGEYGSGGQEEDGLDVAFDKISTRIAQALAGVKV
jgi:outer membrane lipopolysaccharide assembly protein LptE/RlpB